MTDPPVTPAAPAPAPAATEPAPAAPQPSETDLAAQNARLLAQNAELVKHNRTWETRAKANENAAPILEQISKALGGESGPKVTDPEAIVRELSATKAQAREHATEAAVLRAAASAGADGDALLDRISFREKLKAIDLADAAAIKQLITETVAADPKYAAAAPAAAPTAPPVRQASTAGDFNGSPGGGRQLTGADVDRMTPAQVAKAKNDGLLKDYLAS